MSGGAMQLASDTTIELYSDGAPLSGGSLALTVNQSGSINFEPLSSDPSSPSAGDVYYNSTTNKLRCYNGTSWNDLF